MITLRPFFSLGWVKAFTCHLLPFLLIFTVNTSILLVALLVTLPSPLLFYPSPLWGASGTRLDFFLPVQRYSLYKVSIAIIITKCVDYFKTYFFSLGLVKAFTCHLLLFLSIFTVNSSILLVTLPVTLLSPACHPCCFTRHPCGEEGGDK